MPVSFLAENIPFPTFPLDDISRWIEDVILQEENEPGEITIIFCSDNYLLDINKQHLNHDYYTDIITFNYVVDSIISGDLFISLDRTRENSANLNINYLDETLRVIVHGILHLLGYDDSTEKEKIVMRKLEEHYTDLYKKSHP